LPPTASGFGCDELWGRDTNPAALGVMRLA